MRLIFPRPTQLAFISTMDSVLSSFVTAPQRARRSSHQDVRIQVHSGPPPQRDGDRGSYQGPLSRMFPLKGRALMATAAIALTAASFGASTAMRSVRAHSAAPGGGPVFGDAPAPAAQEERADDAAARSAQGTTTKDLETPSAPSTPAPTNGSHASPGGDSPDGLPRRLKLQTGVVLIPHPDKVDKGGEDAYFVSANGLALGIADGVGGWAEVGVDPGLYSKQLMTSCREAADREAQLDAGSPQRIMHHGYVSTRIQGSSTVCILVVSGRQLHASNLGDSGFMVVRRNAVLFQSPQQQHQFNFPYQLGSPGSMSDSPDKADNWVVELAPGDVIVAGTDGLWDNVYPEEVSAIVAAARDEGWDPNRTASRLAKYARRRASDDKYISPFAYSALSMGLMYIGGKQDDISVLVSYVSPAGETQNGGGDGAAATPATPEGPQSRL